MMIRDVAWVYILTNRYHTVLYTGFTTDLISRVREHATKQDPKSFTARYNLNKLVYYQGFSSVEEAENEERYIKGKNRNWKTTLITSNNKEWEDLGVDLSWRLHANRRETPRRSSPPKS